MHPILFEYGALTLYTYGLAMAVAFVAGIEVSARRAPAYGFTPDQMHDSAIPVLAAGLIGAKVTYLFTNRAEISSDWHAMISLVRGGFVFYGGVAGGVAGAVWWARRRGLPLLGYCDMVAPGLAFALAVGRLGCFFNGCCYGKPVGWGLVVPSLGDGLARHPTQLYEVAGASAIGFLLLRVPAPEPARRGRVFALFLIVYAALRFTDEFLRDDPRGPMPGGLSVSQWLSIVGMLLGLALLLRRKPLPA